MSECLAFVGDVHLEQDDPELDDFVAFLQALGERSRRIVLMGDLFTIWIGQREIEQSHQSAVIRTLRSLRQRGVEVHYLEGNRDYRIGPCYRGDALDATSETGLAEEFGGRRLFAAHGNLVNVSDRQYRAWRRFSRSAPVWALFNRLPARLRHRVVTRLEQRFRGTNLGFKGSFPGVAVRDYAAAILADGFDTVVLGHFHQEMQIDVDRPGARGRVFVLPEWKGSRRHLELSHSGVIQFVDSAC